MSTSSAPRTHALDRVRLQAERLWLHPRTPVVALALLALLAFVVILRAGRGLFFFGDEWAFLLHRRGISLETFLAPHNQHPSVGPVASYKLLLAVFGMDSYLPYRIAVALLHLLCGVFVYLYARRRVGARLALIPAAIMFFLGAAWEDVMWGFQVGFIGAVTFGVAALLALDGGRRRDWLTCLALVVSCTSAGIGLPFLLVVLVIILTQPRPLPRLWVVAVPALAFAVSVFGYGGDAQSTYASPSAALRWGLEMAAAGFGAVFGATGVNWGRSLLVLAVVGLVLGLRRGRIVLDARLAALLLGAVAYWLLIGSGRAEIPGLPPDTSRYTYESAVFLLLIGVTALAGVRVTRTTGWVLAAVTLVACVSAAGLFRSGPAVPRLNAVGLLPKLTAADAALGQPVNGDLQIDRDYSPDIDIRSYLSAVEKFGPAGPSLDELRRDNEGAKATFDIYYLLITGIGPKPAPAGTPTGGQCAETAADQDATLEPGRRYVLTSRAAAGVQLRRLAADVRAGETPTPLAADAPAVLQLPKDALREPWTLRVSGAPVRVCAV